MSTTRMYGGSGHDKAPETFPVAEGEEEGVLSCLPRFSMDGLELKKG